MPPPVFLLNPENEAFVNGLAPEPQDENPPWTVVLKLVVVGATVAFVSYWVYKIGRVLAAKWVAALAVVLFIVFAVYATLKSVVVNWRFRRPCKVLFGELLACEVIHDDENVYWRITYRFSNDMGEMIEGRWGTEGMITSVEDRTAPPPGTRLAICYIDDKVHRVL